MQFGKIRTFFYIVNVQRKLVVVRRPSYIHHASVLLGCLDNESGSDLLTGDDLMKTNVKYQLQRYILHPLLNSSVPQLPYLPLCVLTTNTCTYQDHVHEATCILPGISNACEVADIPSTFPTWQVKELPPRLDSGPVIVSTF